MANIHTASQRIHVLQLLGNAIVGGMETYVTRLIERLPPEQFDVTVMCPWESALSDQFRAMGAEVVITRSDVSKGHPDYYQDLAETITRRTAGACYVDQFANPANPLAHETTTGPEILRQMEGRVDAVVVGVGSGGTLTGIGRFMRTASPRTAMPMR